MIPSRQHPKRRVKSWVPATAVLAVGAVALIWFLTGLPVKIKRVRISGLRSISQAQLEQIAGIKPGMDVGRNQALDIGKALVKHPLILEASVDAGVTGTLHIRIRERTPVAWLENRSCAIGADGVLLAGIGERDESWLRLAGLQVEKGRVREIGAVQEAARVDRLLRDSDDFPVGVWCRRSDCPDSWLWVAQGKTVRFSHPVSEEEINRLQRFKRLYPHVWSRARALDMRFADRVVMKR